MKKGICLLLSILFLFSCMPVVIFAEDSPNLDEEIIEEIGNVTVNDSAMAYASSEKNTLWTPAGSLIDGKYSKDTWQEEIVKYSRGDLETAIAICKKLNGEIDTQSQIAVIKEVLKDHCVKLSQITLKLGLEIDAESIKFQ